MSVLIVMVGACLLDLSKLACVLQEKQASPKPLEPSWDACLSLREASHVSPCPFALYKCRGNLRQGETREKLPGKIIGK